MYGCVGGNQTCSDTTDNNVEICNDMDDDCDGDDDEGLPLSTCGVGACISMGTTCAPSSCTPRTPTSEICNGIDDDCANGPDDAPANSMCAPAFPSAQNVSQWACSTAMCRVMTCGSGYANVDTQIANGCECALDTHAAVCMAAASSSAIPVPRPTLAATPVTRAGTIESPADSDWFQVTFASPGVVGEAWNPEITLVGAGHLMDVQQDCTVTPPVACTPTGFGSQITEWDRRYPASPAGANGPPAVNDGNPDTLPRLATYIVRVYLAPNALPVCNGYELRIWNP
jgi:hypothetical protein